VHEMRIILIEPQRSSRRLAVASARGLADIAGDPDRGVPFRSPFRNHQRWPRRCWHRLSG
jgi:hypothetical protein